MAMGQPSRSTPRLARSVRVYIYMCDIARNNVGPLALPKVVARLAPNQLVVARSTGGFFPICRAHSYHRGGILPIYFTIFALRWHARQTSTARANYKTTRTTRTGFSSPCSSSSSSMMTTQLCRHAQTDRQTNEVV